MLHLLDGLEAYPRFIDFIHDEKIIDDNGFNALKDISRERQRRLEDIEAKSYVVKKSSEQISAEESDALLMSGGKRKLEKIMMLKPEMTRTQVLDMAKQKLKQLPTTRNTTSPWNMELALYLVAKDLGLPDKPEPAEAAKPELAEEPEEIQELPEELMEKIYNILSRIMLLKPELNEKRLLDMEEQKRKTHGSGWNMETRLYLVARDLGLVFRDGKLEKPASEEEWFEILSHDAKTIVERIMTSKPEITREKHYRLTKDKQPVFLSAFATEL